MNPMNIYAILIYAIVGIVVAGVAFYACKTMYDEGFIAKYIRSDMIRFFASAALIMIVILIGKLAGIGTFSPYAFEAVIVGILIAGLTILRRKREYTTKANA